MVFEQRGVLLQLPIEYGEANCYYVFPRIQQCDAVYKQGLVRVDPLHINEGIHHARPRSLFSACHLPLH